MLLSKIIPNTKDIEINTLFVDSRKKVENGVFFCMKGLVNDGHRFINQAIENGAVAIVYSDEPETKKQGIEYIKTESVLDALTLALNNFYDDPSHHMTIYGVTGTNGKSTISLTTKNILSHFRQCGYIGTIGVEYADVKKEMGSTTNDLITTYQIFDDMRKAGCEAISMEVSSHGLDQNRVSGIHFDVAIYTNLTHEHLNYHGTMENYFEAKAKFFDMLTEDSIAIINMDDPYGRRMLERCKYKAVTYGIDAETDYQALDLTLAKDHTTFKLKYKNALYDVKTNMVARFNVSNLLAVIAALHETGYALEEIIPLLTNVSQVDGRIEVIKKGQPFNVVVDYAHTPDGFEKIYAYAKDITPKSSKIISVFGSAGLRDRTKRPVLGEISDSYCQMIILTEEDQRTESAEEIANEIAGGIKGKYVYIGDRYTAISQAIEMANKNDTILILGKGDEQFMDRDTRSDYWMGDNNAAEEILSKYDWSEENV